MAAQYPLLALVSARKRREQEASTAVRHASLAVSRCREELQARQAKLAAYHEWRIKETDLRWKKCLGRNMQLKELDEFRASLGELEQGELACQSEVDDAAKALTEAEAALAQARIHLNEAERKLEKLEEHRRIWSREQQKEEERAAENEMDDFRRRVRETSTQDDLELEIAHVS